MGFKLDKHGKYRVNFYLNPDNAKDQVIIDFLNGRYSVNDYMKELLYSLATGSAINNSYVNSNSIMNKSDESISDPNGEVEEYEEIKGVDDIEL